MEEDMPEYRVFGSEELPAVLDIYREAGWLIFRTQKS